jgi:hypothetical protein
VGIGGTIRDKKTQEEEMLTGDTETAMGTAGAQKNCESRRETLISTRASKLCTLIEARVAEFNHVVTAPHTCLSYEHTNMTF